MELYANGATEKVQQPRLIFLRGHNLTFDTSAG